MADLLRKVLAVAEEEGAAAVVRITVRLGALSHMSPEHLRDHWVEASRGTVAEGAAIRVAVGRDPTEPDAQDIRLLSVELPDPPGR